MSTSQPTTIPPFFFLNISSACAACFTVVEFQVKVKPVFGTFLSADAVSKEWLPQTYSHSSQVQIWDSHPKDPQNCDY